MDTEKQPSGHEKYKSLVLATLDYLINHYTGEIVCDGFDPIKEYYEMEQVVAEKYYQAGELKKLKELLDRHTSRMLRKVDLEFAPYIKEKTGYDLDIFAGVRQLGADVLLRGVIQSDEENENVLILLDFYKKRRRIQRRRRFCRAYQIPSIRRYLKNLTGIVPERFVQK